MDNFKMASAKYKEIRKGHERVGEMLASGSNCDASKSGVAQETIQNTVRRGSKAMMEQEARQILGKYDTLFERNAKNGSFYLQSKVHRAKECLEAVHQGNSQGTPS
ncbi:Mitochondrial import inner membrane translocase subunit PAM16 like 2 [Vitis vinifera]|uniref:Mitochondrial import inner membrane translocase subunit PAM16 like 2 n=1 Tax=Vitis vinifera TaxID=29760 RepID=A0A438FG33_VITVI|nr:Mitochondrial import inner membrane translocase subunit PAM16 like 2 [Vitis vinifera]